MYSLLWASFWCFWSCFNTFLRLWVLFCTSGHFTTDFLIARWAGSTLTAIYPLKKMFALYKCMRMKFYLYLQSLQLEVIFNFLGRNVNILNVDFFLFSFFSWWGWKQPSKFQQILFKVKLWNWAKILQCKKEYVELGTCTFSEVWQEKCVCSEALIPYSVYYIVFHGS